VATRDQLLLSCEHGGRRVPAAWRASFRGAGPVLDSHRGYDAGALSLARALSRRLRAPLLAATVTRLLVDLNRSEGHPRLFSELTRGLPSRERQRILALQHRPHRGAVAGAVVRALDRGDRVVHVAVHSFTPVWAGTSRRTEVGLLYDPARPGERRFATAWQRALREAAPGLTVHRNAPYRGTADGLTTALRRRFAPGCYLGLELEVSQGHLVGRGARPQEMARLLADTLSRVAEARR